MSPPTKRRPGRPPSYIFDKPDDALTDLERRLKASVTKRRARQNRSYHRLKALRSAPPTPTLVRLGFSSVRARVAALAPRERAAAADLALFPGTFTPCAAAAVLGRHARAFEPLAAAGVLAPDHGRWRVAPAVRTALGSAAADAALAPAEGARGRYVAHFGRVLSMLTGAAVNKDGGERLKAMHVFDKERDSVEFALWLTQEMGAGVRLDFLRKAASVMRYCTAARVRVTVFREALLNVIGRGDEVFGEEVEIESRNAMWLEEFGAGFCPDMAAAAAAAEGVSGRNEGRGIRNQARVELALGEAYFDMLDIEGAEGPLRRARALLEDVRFGGEGGEGEAAALALPNLLLAEVCVSKGDLVEAKKLLYDALGVLSEAGLSESTLTVHAMNTLVGVHLTTASLDEAMWTCNKMLDVLSSMGDGSYREMPIYADALGTLATVYLSASLQEEAEKLFIEALDITDGWLERRDWSDGAPFEHCKDLDIWLLDGLARALREQGKLELANDRAEAADVKRKERGLRDDEAEQNNALGIAMESGGLLGTETRGMFGIDDFDGSGGGLDIDAFFLPTETAQSDVVSPGLSEQAWLIGSPNRPYLRHIY